MQIVIILRKQSYCQALTAAFRAFPSSLIIPDRDFQCEGAALSQLALHTDYTTMLFSNRFYYRQPQTQAAALQVVGLIHVKEAAEQFWLVERSYPLPMILHGDAEPVIRSLRADHYFPANVAELNRVFDEVENRLLQEKSVRADARIFYPGEIGLNADFALRSLQFQKSDHFLNDFLHIKTGELDAFARI